MIIDEIYKIRFRAILSERKKVEEETVVQKAMNDRIEIVVDLLEKHAKMQMENQTDMRELKVHVGEIEKSLREPSGMPTPSGAEHAPANIKQSASTHTL
jgi:hypothetical protein